MSARSTINSREIRERPRQLSDNSDEDNGYRREIDLQYGSTVRKVDRFNLSDKYIRSLFKVFPADRAILLKAKNGVDIPIEEFENVTVNGNKFRVIEGDRLPDSKSREPVLASNLDKMRKRRRAYDDDSDDDQPKEKLRPPKPNFARKSDYGRQSLGNKGGESGQKIYIPVQYGIQMGKRIVPSAAGRVKNIAVFRKHFCFNRILEIVFEQFDIDEDQRESWCLMNALGHILSSDAKYNDFSYWQGRARSSIIYLVWQQSDGNESDQDSDEADFNHQKRDFETKVIGCNRSNELDFTERKTLANTRSTERKNVEKNYSKIPSRNESRRIVLDDIDLEDHEDLADDACTGDDTEQAVAESEPYDWRSYLNDVTPESDVKSDSVVAKAAGGNGQGNYESRETSGGATLGSGEMYDTFEELLDRLECLFCGNTASSPQCCPRFGHNMGGAKCVQKWFKELTDKGREKTCPKCRALVGQYGIHEQLAKQEQILRKMKLKQITFCQ